MTTRNIIKTTTLLLISLFVFFIDNCTAKALHGIAGFRLGSNIEKCENLICKKTAVPIRYNKCVEEVEIKNIEGYKSGIIAYGKCVYPNQIIRIKLKYADSSRKFYDILLDKFKKRFGNPSEWKGDPFHIVIAWKWSFKDKNGGKVTLIVQHNNEDDNQKKGNSVKLTLLSFMEKEIFYYRKQKKNNNNNKKKNIFKKKKYVNWEKFIPY